MTTNHEHLREVAEKATPGPWTFSNADGEWVIRDANQKYLGGLMKGTRQLANTAVFIATFSPATAIALLDELAALRKENEGLRMDAERYRYVRESGSEFVHYTGGGTHGMYEEEELDKRVDGVLRDFIEANRAAIGDSHE